jgi:hypothetical protein
MQRRRAGATGIAAVPGRAPRVAAAAALVGVTMSAAAPAYAQQLTVEPSVSLWTRYDDNLRLRPVDEQAVWQTTLTPAVQLDRRTEALHVRAQALLNLIHYDRLENRDQQLLRLRSRYTGERHGWGLDGDLRRDTTLALIPEGFVEPVTPTDEVELELPPGDVIDPDVTEIGLVPVEVRRNRIVLRPSFDYALTERTQVGVQYQLIDVNYGEDAATSLIDYQQHRGALDFAYRLSPVADVSTTVGYTRYRAPGLDTTVDNVDLTGTYRWAVTETLDASFSAGVRRTEREVAAVEESSTGVLLGATARHRGERTVYTANATREVSPSGAGELIESDRLGLSIDHEWRPRLTVGFRADAFWLRPLGDVDVRAVERRFLRLEPRFRYELTRWLDVDGSYRYRHQKRTVDDRAAESNAFFLAVRYTWPRRTLPF